MRIKDLGNTATDFASDDYIALDGTTNGSRKMKSDALLKVTAQNSLDRIKNLSTTYTAANMPNDAVVAISSATGSGKSTLENVVKSGRGLFMSGNMASNGDANDAPLGSILWCQGSGITNIPQDAVVHAGNLLTYKGQLSGSDYNTQIFIDVSGNLFVRFKQYGGSWTAWKRQANVSDISSLSTSFDNKLLNYLKMSGAAVTIGLKDANNALPATFYWVQPDATYSNFPEGVVGGNLLTLLANMSLSTQYVTQMFFDISGNMWVRFKRYGGSWTSWKRVLNESDLQPFESLKESLNYPSLSCFQKVGVVGDSYASALVYDENGVSKGNRYPISWPQILGRSTGCLWTNFTQGGLSTRSWLTSERGLPLMLSSDPCDLYILVLGINDRTIDNYLGGLADITSHSSMADYGDTFYGNYGRIIENILQHSPAAKIIMSTMANYSGTGGQSFSSFNSAIEEIAGYYNLPVIKQYNDAFFQSAIYTTMYGQHPTKVGQAGMATALQRLIQQCMVANLTYFNSFDGEE